jgi:hypothetical protein
LIALKIVARKEENPEFYFALLAVQSKDHPGCVDTIKLRDSSNVPEEATYFFRKVFVDNLKA